MVERTKYLTEATLFAPAANKWGFDRGILNNNGGLLLLKASRNLSDLTDIVNARVNLGLRIGADVQPYNERLTAYSNGATPSSFSLVAMGKTTALEWRDFIGAGTVKSVTVSGGSTGLVFTNGTTIDTGTSTLSGVLSPTNGGTGVTSLSSLKTSLNLGNVDNTSDLSKPISNAVQAALDTKFDKPIGSVGQYIRGDGSIAAFPDFNDGVGTVTSITVSGGTTGLLFDNGTITESGTVTLTGTLSIANGGTGVTTLLALRNLLNIENVDNTSDVNKPISTAVQIELNSRVRSPAGLPNGIVLTLPDPAPGKVIGWNDLGNALINTDGGTGGGGTTVPNEVDVFDGDGTTVEFTLSTIPGSIDDIGVTIGGVSQTPDFNYTLYGSVLTLTAPAPAGEKVVVRTFGSGTPSEMASTAITTDPFDEDIIPDGSNVQEALQALETAVKNGIPSTPGGIGGSVARTQTFTSVEGQASYVLDYEPLTLAEVDVSIGGIVQVPGVDFTISASKTITFLSPVTAGVTILVRYGSQYIVGEGTAVRRVQQFTSIEGQSDYVLSFEPLSQDELDVSFGSLVQYPDIDFIFVEPNIVRFVGDLDPGQPILVKYGSQYALGGNNPSVGISHVDRYMGNGILTQFTLNNKPGSINNLLVIIDGVPQKPIDNYNLSNEVLLTFNVPPPSTADIFVYYSSVLEMGATRASLVATNAFHGTTIPDGSNVQQALQALETRTEAVSRVIPIDPREFGAYGNNTGDDTVAFQTALNLSRTSGRPVGAAGVFRIDGTLDPKGATIVWKGQQYGRENVNIADWGMVLCHNSISSPLFSPTAGEFKLDGVVVYDPRQIGPSVVTRPPMLQVASPNHAVDVDILNCVFVNMYDIFHGSSGAIIGDWRVKNNRGYAVRFVYNLECTTPEVIFTSNNMWSPGVWQSGAIGIANSALAKWTALNGSILHVNCPGSSVDGFKSDNDFQFGYKNAVRVSAGLLNVSTFSDFSWDQIPQPISTSGTGGIVAIFSGASKSYCTTFLSPTTSLTAIDIKGSGVYNLSINIQGQFASGKWFDVRTQSAGSLIIEGDYQNWSGGTGSSAESCAAIEAPNMILVFKPSLVKPNRVDQIGIDIQDVRAATIDSLFIGCGRALNIGTCPTAIKILDKSLVVETGTSKSYINSSGSKFVAAGSYDKP